ncbi:MAG: hypothetical protein ACOCTT_00475 [archaeon]
MKKGQLLIFTAVMIAFALSGVIALSVQLQMGTRADYDKTNPTVMIRRNFEKELIMLVETDPYNETRFNKSIEDMRNSAKGKGIELDADWEKIEGNDLTLSECDFFLDKSMTALNSSGEAWQFNVVIRDPEQVKTSSNFKVCWD